MGFWNIRQINLECICDNSLLILDSPVPLSDLLLLSFLHCRYVEELENNPDINHNETLGQFLKSRSYSELFQEAYLVRPLKPSILSHN